MDTERTPSVEALLPLAAQFNAAVLEVPAAVRPISLRRHPEKGSCMDASILFATLLVRLGFPNPRLISGEYLGALPSHAWLRFGTLDVDITAGQFADAPAPIVIAEVSAWHRRSFEEEADPAPAALSSPRHAGYEEELRKFGEILWKGLRW